MTKYYKRARDVDAEPSISYVHWLTMDPDGTHPDGGNLTDEVVVDIHPTADFPNWILESNDFVWYSAVDETTYLVKATQPVFQNLDLSSTTGWQYGGLAWNINTTTKKAERLNVATSNGLYQSVTKTAGHRWGFKWDMGDYVSGNIHVWAGGAASHSATFSGDGTHSVSITIDNDNAFAGYQGSASASYKIYNLEVVNLTRTRWNPLYGGSGSIGGYLSHATATSQPWYGGYDGYNGFLGFTTHDRLDSSLSAASWKFLTKTATPASAYFILSQHANGWVAVLSTQVWNATGIGLLLNYEDGKYTIDVRNGTDAQRQTFTSADVVVTLGEAHLLEYHKDSADNVSLILNGKTIVSGNCTIFANQDPQQCILPYIPVGPMMMGDIIFYNGVLTEDEKEGIRNRLMTSHGIDYDAF